MTREQAINYLISSGFTQEQVCEVVRALTYAPTTKNNLGVEEVTALAEWTEKLTKASEDAYNKGYADGMKAQEPRWIPVSERLPEANRAVLTYIDTGATKTYCLAYWNDVREAWEEWIGYDLIEKDRDYKVIAWMPLPKTYREVEE